MRTRVKICGITQVEDAHAVANAGVDSIGLVFYEKSKRNVDIYQAKLIAESLPAFVGVTALFLDASPSFVDSVLSEVPISLLQFHGNESPESCDSYNLPYIKAIGMRDRIDLQRYTDLYPTAAGFLLDSHGMGEAGGTGEVFDWTMAKNCMDRPLILAGGLVPENIALAIKTVNPWAVDLSSGVESAPGAKDSAKIIALMNEVRRVNCE